MYYFGVSPAGTPVGPRGSIHPVPPNWHPATAPARPYMPPPRVVVNRYIPGPTRTVYTPGATRYVPGPTIVRPDYGAIQRAREAQANWDRERSHLERMRYHDREAAARYALLQQQLYQAQMAAQQQPTVPPPPSYDASVPGTPQNVQTVSPTSPAADLTPQQDAADGGGGGGDEGGGEPSHKPKQDAADGGGGGGDEGGGEPSHKPKHLMLFVGLIAVVGVGGYMFLHKKKTAKKSD